jgi:hypothetical protein
MTFLSNFSGSEELYLGSIIIVAISNFCLIGCLLILFLREAIKSEIYKFIKNEKCRKWI